MPSEGMPSKLSRIVCAFPCIPTTEAIPYQWRLEEKWHHVYEAVWVEGKIVATILCLETLERLEFVLD